MLMAIAPNPPPSTPKRARFVFRPYRRIPTWRVLYYLSKEYVGKGVVTNLSQFGMRVQGEHEVEPGLNIALRLTLADDGPTVEIERATVRWVDGYDFGLDFVHINPVATKHIADLLNQKIRSSPLSY
jgi:PilZ domain